MVFEWLVQPPPIIPSYCSSYSEQLLLRFKLHGPWYPEGPYEFLLFTVHFKPLGQFPPQPAIPLPWPYDSVRANGFTFIPYDAVYAGHNLVSFSDIIIGPVFPGHYQFEVSAFIVTLNGVNKLLPGYILSHPIHIQSCEEEHTDVMLGLRPPRCLCCGGRCWGPEYHFG